jgi:hypothetical protein
MINKAIHPLIHSLVPRLFGGNGLSYGLPFVTTDGFALLTTDDEVLLASTATPLTGSQPQQPLVTSDGYALFDSNEQFIY